MHTAGVSQSSMLADLTTKLVMALAVAATHQLTPATAQQQVAQCTTAVDCTSALQAALNDTTTGDLLIPPRSATGGGSWVVQPLLIAVGDKNITLATTLEARAEYFHGLHDMLVTIRGTSHVSLRGGSSSNPGVLRMRKKDYLATGGASGALLYNHSEWRHAVGIYDSTAIHMAHLLIAWAGGDGIYIDRLVSATIVGVHVNESYRNAMSIISATDLVVSDCLFTSASPHSSSRSVWP